MSATARQQPHQNNVKVARQQQEAKIHFFKASNRQSALPVGLVFTYFNCYWDDNGGSVPTIWIWSFWKYLIGGWIPSLRRENQSFLPVIKGQYWSLCNTKNTYTHFFYTGICFCWFSVSLLHSKNHKASVVPGFSVLIWKVPLSPRWRRLLSP